MFETLLTSGQLEERADGAWTRGPHFSPAGLQAQCADAQRTAFAIHAIRGIDIGALTAAVAQEDNVVWARFRMPADLSLPVMHLPVAPAGRAGPRALGPSPGDFQRSRTIVRDVSLKPGLNIVWTPDMSAAEAGLWLMAAARPPSVACFELASGSPATPRTLSDRVSLRGFRTA